MHTAQGYSPSSPGAPVPIPAPSLSQPMSRWRGPGERGFWTPLVGIQPSPSPCASVQSLLRWCPANWLFN